MALIVSNTALNLMREYVQNQTNRVSLHPTTPTTANEVPASSGYISPRIGQGNWADSDGGIASNTLPLPAGTLTATVQSIEDVALRSATEAVLLSNNLTTPRTSSVLVEGAGIRIPSGALSLDFISSRGTGDTGLAISNTLRAGLINAIIAAAASATMHSAQPTDASRPTDDMEISTSTGYQPATLNSANWSNPEIDGVSRNLVVISFGGDLTTAIPSITHVAIRNAAGDILIENDLTATLTNIAIGQTITIPANSLSLRMVA